MYHRPKFGTIHNNVWKYNNKGSAHYTAHFIDISGVAKIIGDEKSGQGNRRNPATHPDQEFWKFKSQKIVNVLEKINNPICRIEIDCTLLPCNRTNGCLYAVPLLIKKQLSYAKHSSGFEKLKKVDVKKIPLRIFSHRMESKGSKVIFCLVGDNRYKLTAAYENRADWMWTEYKNKYVGPDITNGGRTFKSVPELQ